MTAAELTGDVRKQIAQTLLDWTCVTWDDGDRLDMADAVLALPAVRDALAAQETLRRVKAVAKYYEQIAARYDLTDIHRATCRTAADRIRRALAGDQ